MQGVASGTLVGPLNTNVAADVNGSFGKINIANDGTYTYTVDNSNTSVQALRTSAQTLTDTFSYTEKDTAGGTSTTQVTVTIHGQNDNPTAVADGATAVEAGGTNNGTAGSNATGNVLTNDTDPDSVANGETQTVQGVESGSHVADTVSTGAGSPITGAHGTLTLNTNGSFTYVVNNADSTVDALNTGQSTTDTFTYTMHDAANTTSTAVLTVTINGADDAPIAVNQGSAASPAYSAFDAVALNVAAAGVKTGATDVDNTFASLTAVKDTNPAHGSVTVNSDGSFTYTATAGYFGNDSFNYHISDGTLSSNSATAFINVTPHVAYIDNTASAVGEDGSLAHPFASIADFNTANTIANHFDIIYVEKGTGTYTTSTGITLQAGQILEGQGVDPSYVRGDNGQTVVLHDFDNTAGSIATIQVTSGAAVTLNSGNTIQGLNITGVGFRRRHHRQWQQRRHLHPIRRPYHHRRRRRPVADPWRHRHRDHHRRHQQHHVGHRHRAQHHQHHDRLGQRHLPRHLGQRRRQRHRAEQHRHQRPSRRDRHRHHRRLRRHHPEHDGRFDQPDLDPGRQPRRHERHGLEGLRHHRPHRERHRAQPRQRLGQRRLHRQ